MQALAIRTSLRDEVQLSSTPAADSRGQRGWSAVELPEKHWIQARRTEFGSGGQYETRQWLTCDFMEALRFGRGEGVVRFRLFVGVFTPQASPGYLFGEVVEVLRSTGAGVFVVRFGSGVSVTVSRDSAIDAAKLTAFESVYHADTWRAAD